MKFSYLSGALLALSLSTYAFADVEPVKIAGSTPATIIINTTKPLIKTTNHYPRATNGATEVKHIMLQHIVLSPNAKQYLAKKASEQTTPVEPVKSDDAIDLKMGEGDAAVPVLDQGRHGSCVTFAATAIVDAAAKKGDYISQLCNLELTATLYPPTPMGPHGWEGSTTFIIMAQIKRYGIISKQYQKTSGCAGVYEYPGSDQFDWGNPMTLNEFSSHSEPIMANIGAHPILRTSIAFSKDANMEAAFLKVKKALANKHRVIIGYLVDTGFGGVGAFGNHKAKNDSWVMTSGIRTNLMQKSIDAGHAIIIIGYDDTAIITNPDDNSQHKGAFKLRNSWGEAAGDHGDYYMSYDYFKMMTEEAIEII